jgi:hypothetical protein
MGIDNEEEKNPSIGNLVSIPSSKKVSKHTKSVTKSTVSVIEKDGMDTKIIDKTPINASLELKKGNLQNININNPPPRIRLSSPKTLRKSMANIMKAAVLGNMDMDKARSLAYLAQTLSVCFKMESDLGVEKALKEMRKEIAALENKGVI